MEALNTVSEDAGRLFMCVPSSHSIIAVSDFGNSINSADNKKSSIAYNTELSSLFDEY